MDTMMQGTHIMGNSAMMWIFWIAVWLLIAWFIKASVRHSILAERAITHKEHDGNGTHRNA